MDESEIQVFWNEHPCGESLVGGSPAHRSDYEAFFSAYDAFRYRTEAHILKCLDRIDFNGKNVLEIGLGQGADSEQIIKRGAVWSGLDVSEEAVTRVRARATLRSLPHASIKHGSVLDIPFPAGSFDLVFSHGVLHHVPNIAVAQREIHRVLRPDGELVAMLYAKWSLNYVLSIAVLRRLGLLALSWAHYNPGGAYGQHLANARATGLLRYLRLSHFIHKNTDGPLNPYSKVYDLGEVNKDFSSFKVTRSYKQFMHSPPLALRWLPLQSILGWHLWVHMKPR